VGLFSIDIDDADDARQAARKAGIAGFVSVAITVLFIGIALAGATDGPFALLNAWSLLEAAVLAGLAWGTYRANRFAAVGLLVVYVVEQALIRVSTGSASGLVLTAVFVFLFVQGVRGTLFLHREEQRDELEQQVASLEQPPSDPLA
jgi:hypothetical protein